ncbi:hypothetical protein SAMN04487977_101453 [Treponema bryantii]|uniref:Uncharacterized protein n=1 Tax=Treponema bryantii TaxID=163 RepID=A0A1H9AUP9_9SPIR|nr:hypothetical protein [Treponema bryantii]SEP79658.1 hypothetical protein SAMN04487977_101453 [Treponema bryantii]
MYPYQQQWLPFPPPQPQLNSRFVTNIEEAKASMIDAVSTNLFVDTSTGKIYLKKLNNNGQADFFVYAIEEQKPPKDPLEEINTRLTKIENFIGGLNDKSVSNDVGYAKSEPVPYSTVAKPNEPNDEAKSTGFPKDAGNGWRKK